MSAVKIVAILLIIVGLLGLVYGRFSYTRETQEAKLGPLAQMSRLRKPRGSLWLRGTRPGSSSVERFQFVDTHSSRQTAPV